MTENHGWILPRLREKVKKLLDAAPRCHDWDHTDRVCSLAKRMAHAEEADETVVACGALLHDIGRSAELNDKGRTCHAREGARRVPELLREMGITDGAFIARVTECVRTHRFRKRDENPPASLEARIVFDADKLDSMGAMGIGRAFHFAGRIGARVHNTREEALSSKSYSAEDTAYREFLVKLSLLHDSVLTDTGKRLSENRHRFMNEFFEQLNREADNTDLPQSEKPQEGKK